MTAGGVLVAVGGMLVLAGLVLAVTTMLGIGWTPRRRGWRVVTVPRHFLAATAAGLVVLLLTGWIAAAAGAAAAVVLIPSIWATSGIEHQIAVLDALASWTRRMADLLRSGAAGSLETALVKSALVAPEQIRGAVSRLAGRIGPQGIERALMRFAAEVADPVGDEIVMALVLQSRHGGRGLAQVLSGLAGTVDDQVRMRREVEADRARYRSNARTIVLLFVGMSAGMLLFAHPFLAPYGTSGGQLALALVVGVFCAALLWLRRMMRQPPGQRLLSPDDFGSITRGGGAGRR